MEIVSKRFKAQGIPVLNGFELCPFAAEGVDNQLRLLLYRLVDFLEGAYT